MRVVIDEVEYVPVTSHELGNKLVRMLVSEFWGSVKDKSDEWVANEANNLGIRMTENINDIKETVASVVARMLRNWEE